MGFFKWCGRVVLWLFFWPAGLWRSLRHGRRKDARAIAEAIKERSAPWPPRG